MLIKNRKTKKNAEKLRLRLTVLATFLGCLIIFQLIHELEKHASKINPAHVFFRDFDFSDAYYKINNDLKTVKAKDIIIINTGKSTRENVASIIERLNKVSNKPKVIGLDYFFNKENDSLDSIGTARLASAIINSDNLVLGYRWSDIENSTADDRYIPGSSFLLKDNRAGYISLSDSVSTIRMAPMILQKLDKPFYSFGLQVAARYYSADGPIIKKVYGKQLDSIRIEYIPANAFTLIQADTLARVNSTELNGKCILIGDCSTGNDLHFTPLNPQLGGRSFPDMAGVFIHANIIYTLSSPDDRHAFRELEDWETLSIASLICLIFLYLLVICYTKWHTFFHFGCVLIYEPLIYYGQLYLSVFLYHARIHMSFETSYLLLAIAPFSIYIIHFLDTLLNKVLKYFSKGRLQSPSYYHYHQHHI